MAATTQPQGLQIFYKPGPGQPGYDANNPQAVYDDGGNIISEDQYKQATGQADKPNNEVDWSAVQPGAPTSGFGNNPTFNPNNIPGLASVWGQLSPADQAFIESANKVVAGQYNAGGPATVDQNTWAKALQIVSTDPNIQAVYGDAAKQGAQALAFNLGQITNNYAASQASQQADLTQQRNALTQQIQTAGEAYSGFRQQAQNQLNAQQNNIIQSTRSTLQGQLQTLGSQYEKTFGSTALGQAGPITAGGYSYNPVGGIIGSNTQAQTNAETTLAQNQGILPSVSSSTGNTSTTGGQ